MRSVFFKDHLVDWSLTGKEKSQLLDLWEDWGSLVVDQVWEWNSQSTLPLRFMVEFVLSICLFLQERYSTVNPECRVQETEEVIDWAWV